jgi:4-hydroxybenzoate polyprenyltransferase
MRELVKDLENIKGDLTLDYKTIPVVYGERFAKVMLSVIVALTLLPIFMLIFYYEIGKMNYFFYFSLVLLLVFMGVLWKSSRKFHYLILHNILKCIVVVGVFSIPLINVNLLLSNFQVFGY